MVSLAKQLLTAGFSKLHCLLPRTFWKWVTCSCKAMCHWPSLPSSKYIPSQTAGEKGKQDPFQALGNSHSQVGTRRMNITWLLSVPGERSYLVKNNLLSWTLPRLLGWGVSTGKRTRRSSRMFSSNHIKLLLEYHWANNIIQRSNDIPL